MSYNCLHDMISLKNCTQIAPTFLGYLAMKRNSSDIDISPNANSIITFHLIIIVNIKSYNYQADFKDDRCLRS